jgi:hypothetical protein
VINSVTNIFSKIEKNLFKASVKEKIEVFKTTGGIDFLGFQLVVLKKII